MNATTGVETETVERRRGVEISIPEKRRGVRILDYSACKRFFDAFRFRLKFLSWEVHVELLEMVSGAALWIMAEDMFSLYCTGAHNQIYDRLFLMGPHWADPRIFWGTVYMTTAVPHLVAVLYNRLRPRMNLMAFGCLLQLGVVVCMWGSADYALAWKFLLLFVVSSFWSHIRLRKEFVKCRTEKRKAKPNDSTGQAC